MKRWSIGWCVVILLLTIDIYVVDRKPEINIYWSLKRVVLLLKKEKTDHNQINQITLSLTVNRSMEMNNFLCYSLDFFLCK